MRTTLIFQRPTTHDSRLTIFIFSTVYCLLSAVYSSARVDTTPDAAKADFFERNVRPVLAN